MGWYDSACGESGLVIENSGKPQRLIVIREIAKPAWRPIALPIAGTSDRGGTMEVPKKLDANMKAVQAFGKTLVYADAHMKEVKLDLAKGLEGTLIEIRADGGGATQDGDRISFTLIAGDVYEAIVRAVTKNSPSAWMRYAQVALGVPELPLPFHTSPKRKKPKIDPTVKRLAEAVLASPADQGARSVFVDQLLERDDPRGRLLAVLPTLGKLSFDELAKLAFGRGCVQYDKSFKPALVELVRFLAWGTTLAPCYGVGRYYGYTQRAKDDDRGVQPYVERARKKYAGMPELLAACDANERAFRALAADTGHDDA